MHALLELLKRFAESGFEADESGGDRFRALLRGNGNLAASVLEIHCPERQQCDETAIVDAQAAQRPEQLTV
jgi:hypothetical protein